MKKTAIITGISGQDGAYLSKHLLDKGYHIIGITRNKTQMTKKRLQYLDIIEDIEYFEMPILEKSKILKILKKTKADEIYNLSSQSSVGYSFEVPYETINYNIISVLYWLESIKELNLPTKFYQASSSEMFGNIRQDDLPIKESFVFNPASPYGISKAASHWITVNYREANHLFACCGILFNHESALRGDKFVVKKIINTAIKIKEKIIKEKLKLGNTKIIRDWGYAPEYVKAMHLMLQNTLPNDYIICSGNKMSLDYILNFVFKLLGLEIQEHVITNPLLLRPNDLSIIYGDNSKAVKELRWDYSYTNDELITKLINDEYKYIEWELKSL